MRGWICLKVKFTKIDFQKVSNLLNKFESVLSSWNILEIVLFGKFCLVLPYPLEVYCCFPLRLHIFIIHHQNQKPKIKIKKKVGTQRIAQNVNHRFHLERFGLQMQLRELWRGVEMEVSVYGHGGKELRRLGLWEVVWKRSVKKRMKGLKRA